MTFRTRLLSILLVITLLTACGGRAAHPVKKEQVGDERLTCGDISFEIKNNEVNIASLERENQRDRKKNVVKGMFFFMIFPLFFIDMQMAPAEEIRGYEERNAYLTSLYGQRCRQVQ